MPVAWTNRFCPEFSAYRIETRERPLWPLTFVLKNSFPN